MSSASGCIVYLIVGFFGGLWYVYSGVNRYRLVQKINNTATSKVDAAAIGLVELCGKARCAGEMSSPVSNEKCAFWRVIGQYYRSGKHGGWRQIFRRDSSERFYLEDETGKMLIDPNGAQVEIPCDHTYQGYISGKGIFAFCGIGNPLAFRSTLMSIGAEVKEFLAFRDHYPYNQKDLKRILEGAKSHGADWIVTTEKDIMRLQGRDIPGNIVTLEIEFAIGESFYRELLVEG